MKPKFEIGDRIRHKDTDMEGAIIKIDPPYNYLVHYDKDPKDDYYVWESDIEFANPKEVFLTRLQELLGTFDAEIGICLDHTYSEEVMVLMNYKIVAAGRTITAANVFNYDKD